MNVLLQNFVNLWNDFVSLYSKKNEIYCHRLSLFILIPTEFPIRHFESWRGRLKRRWRNSQSSSKSSSILMCFINLSTIFVFVGYKMEVDERALWRVLQAAIDHAYYRVMKYSFYPQLESRQAMFCWNIIFANWVGTKKSGKFGCQHLWLQNGSPSEWND